MRYQPTGEQEAWRAEVALLAQKLVAPLAEEMDELDETPAALQPGFAEAGLFATTFPERWGGTGPDMLRFVIAVEELARVSAAAALMVAVQALGSFPMEVAATDEQKGRWYPELASGRALASFALTEPEAGSDAAGVRTRAERVEGGWRLTGMKQYISGASLSRLYVVFARVGEEPGGRGITALLVDAQKQGFRVGELHRKMGIRGFPVGRIHLDGYLAAEDDLLGEPGRGLRIALATLDRSRPGVAAQALGIARGALDYALGHARQRIQFGKPIAEQQGVAFMLADMEAGIEASRLLVYRAAEAVQHGSPEVTRLSAIAKLVATDTSMRVTTDAVQVMGGPGYMREHPVERMMRDAKITQIYEGTNQIQRVVIARKLLERGQAPGERTPPGS